MVTSRGEGKLVTFGIFGFRGSEEDSHSYFMKALVRKIDWHVMLWAVIMFASLNMDRSNLVQANTDNFLDDLGLTTDGTCRRLLDRVDRKDLMSAQHRLQHGEQPVSDSLPNFRAAVADGRKACASPLLSFVHPLTEGTISARRRSVYTNTDLLMEYGDN